MKKRIQLRKIVLTGAMTTVIGLAGMLIMVRQVRRNGGGQIYKDAADAPQAPVAVVFGAGYGRGGLSAVLEDRVLTAVDLYKENKVPKLLMTGDNGRRGYSEPDAMKREAVRLGVPASDIVCDYAGFHTYDSVYRAMRIFGVKRALFVTQTYHLHRALYLGRRLGLDVDGVSANRRTYPDQKMYDTREFASTIAAWVDINVTHPLPRYLGRKEADLRS